MISIIKEEKKDRLERLLTVRERREHFKVGENYIVGYVHYVIGENRGQVRGEVGASF